MSSTQVKIGKRQITLSNLQKVLYPAAGFTKGQVLEYYAKIAPVMLPHLKGRPITLKRYPNGVTAHFFYEKNCPSFKPEWIPTKRVSSRNERGHVDFCLVKEEASLVWIANLASLEIHTLLSDEKDIDRPTMMVFDLDPGPPANILDCIVVGKEFRMLLKQAGLESFPKTSGGKGLHIYVPLNTPVTFDQTKAFSHALAQLMEKQDPKRVTSMMRKSLREGKVFVDWSQNDESKTTCAAYSLRARERPTVSTPVTWEELDKALKKKDPSLLVFEASDVLKRADKYGDLFEPVLKLKQKLPKLAAGESEPPTKLRRKKAAVG